MTVRKRDKQVKFYVTDDELKLIDRGVKMANATSRGAYLRKMAIDGYVINVDTSDLKAVVKEMNAIDRNINQITRTANAYGVSERDIEEINAKVGEIWQLLRYTLLKVRSTSQ